MNVHNIYYIDKKIVFVEHALFQNKTYFCSENELKDNS